MKLGDFGLSTQLNSSMTQQSAASGTPLYMAPEVFNNQASLKSDIWSLAISALELAEPDNPFFGSYQSIFSVLVVACSHD